MKTRLTAIKQAVADGDYTKEDLEWAILEIEKFNRKPEPWMDSEEVTRLFLEKKEKDDFVELANLQVGDVFCPAAEFAEPNPYAVVRITSGERFYNTELVPVVDLKTWNVFVFNGDLEVYKILS